MTQPPDQTGHARDDENAEFEEDDYLDEFDESEPTDRAGCSLICHHNRATTSASARRRASTGPRTSKRQCADSQGRGRPETTSVSMR